MKYKSRKALFVNDNMSEKIIREERALIFIGIVLMLIFTPTVAAFLYMLLSDTETLSFNYHIQFYCLVAIVIMGVKDSFLALITFITKFFSPYYIKINYSGIYDCKLKQLITWDKIEKIEYLNYAKSFYNKRSLIEYLVYMFIFGKSFAVIFDFLKSFLYAHIVVESKIPVIYTNYKKEILSKAGIFKKIESYFLPNNMIKINIDYDLTNRQDESEDLLKDIRKFMPCQYRNI